jgi:hypothetical protein
MYFSLHFSGRELFLSDSSLFVDDAEAYEKYQRESGSDVTEQKVKLSLISFQPLLSPRSLAAFTSYSGG